MALSTMKAGYALDILVRLPRWELPNGKWDKLTAAVKDDRFSDLGGSTYIRLCSPKGIKCYYLGSTLFGLTAHLFKKQYKKINVAEVAQVYLALSYSAYYLLYLQYPKQWLGIASTAAVLSVANARHVPFKALPKDDYQNFDRVISFAISSDQYKTARSIIQRHQQLGWRLPFNITTINCTAYALYICHAMKLKLPGKVWYPAPSMLGRVLAEIAEPTKDLPTNTVQLNR